MSIRRLLVPVTGQESDQPLLETALNTARGLNAHVDALFVRAEPTEYLPVMGEGYSGMVAQDIIDAVETAADDMSKRALQAVETAASKEGINKVAYGDTSSTPSISFHQSKGPILAVLQEESQLTDLVVYSKPTPGLGSELGNVLPDLLIGCRRPFLITPDTAAATVGKHVIIGWDGSIEAASAVRQARGFLPLADKVEVVVVNEDKELGAVEAARPISYLAYHGVKAEARVITEKTRMAADILLVTAKSVGADLLVMGAYGHSRVREFIFGGVTRQILQTADMPVFMAH